MQIVTLPNMKYAATLQPFSKKDKVWGGTQIIMLYSAAREMRKKKNESFFEAKRDSRVESKCVYF